jgi:hypothetical protein
MFNMISQAKVAIASSPAASLERGASKLFPFLQANRFISQRGKTWLSMDEGLHHGVPSSYDFERGTHDGSTLDYKLPNREVHPADKQSWMMSVRPQPEASAQQKQPDKEQ